MVTTECGDELVVSLLPVGGALMVAVTVHDPDLGVVATALCTPAEVEELRVRLLAAVRACLS